MNVFTVNYDDLKSHRYGKYVLIHFRLRDFIEKRENWTKFQMQQQKKRKVFDEFLNTGSLHVATVTIYRIHGRDKAPNWLRYVSPEEDHFKPC